MFFAYPWANSYAMEVDLPMYTNNLLSPFLLKPNIYALHVWLWNQWIRYSIIVSLPIHSRCRTKTSTVKNKMGQPINQPMYNIVNEAVAQGAHRVNQYTYTINNFLNQVSQYRKLLPLMKFFIMDTSVMVKITMMIT